MDVLLIAAHSGFAMLWLGCVLTEALFERVMLAGDRGSHLRLADLHVRVDTFIEIPAILIVVVTGVVLWLRHPQAGVAFFLMLDAGLVAIAANAWCVWLVFARRAAAHAERWDDFDRLNDVQHKVGAVVLLGLLTAIVAGVAGRL